MNKENYNDLYIGIDLGTTNSVLAITNKKANGELKSVVVDLKRAVDIYGRNGKFQLEKKPTLPSCVYYDEERGYQPIVGNFAKDRFSVRPHLVAKSIKSHMGEADVSNLGFAEEIPDKTPADISSRILRHMLSEVEKTFHTNIQEAVITVPANFNSIMVKATRDAAQKAGLRIFNEDGSEKPIILEEPKAVLYDFINKASNGEIANCILDLNTPKNVMVFDLGGGTLDITLHEVKRREDYPDIIKVDDIAINRYTLLGGDDFDKTLAQEMYKRFLGQFQGREDIVRNLKRDEGAIMAQLLTYAEDVKIELSNQADNDCLVNDNWGWNDEEENAFDVGGNVGSTGFSYDDRFTKEELEKIFAKFMGREFSLKDYHAFPELNIKENDNNIIYPILDVLYKAKNKLGQDSVRVDAVILNGGMSKFYMIKDRLKEFFGFAPIEAMDPDQAVARGAAIYHYYLKKSNYALQDDMRLVGDEGKEKNTTTLKRDFRTEKAFIEPGQMIQWGRNIINDSLYLGTFNDTHTKIISAGTELPYTSPELKGFRLKANDAKGRIDIPIEMKTINGKGYKKIACGQINFSHKYPQGAYVVLKLKVSHSKIITMEAFTSEDEAGTKVLEHGLCTIEISDTNTTRQKKKLLPAAGMISDPQSMLNALANIYLQKKRNKWHGDKVKERSAAAGEIKTQIFQAANPEDYGKYVLSELRKNNSCEEYRCNLMIIGRKLCDYWSDKEKGELARLSLENLEADFMGFTTTGEGVNTKIQSIYALSKCGSKKDILKLVSLRELPAYKLACLYVFGQQRIDFPWLLQALKDDYTAMSRYYKKSCLQQSTHAIGIAFNNYICENKEEMLIRGEAAEYLLKAITNYNINAAEHLCAIIALGLVCDQRIYNRIDERLLKRVKNTLENIGKYLFVDNLKAGIKCSEIALKLVCGELLSHADEKYLLEKINIYNM